MSCPAITLTGITPDKFATLLATAQSKGLALSGPSGSTSFQGIDVSWTHDPAAATLTLHVTNKPFFLPCSLIESQIRSYLP